MSSLNDLSDLSDSNDLNDSSGIDSSVKRDSKDLSAKKEWADMNQTRPPRTTPSGKNGGKVLNAVALGLFCVVSGWSATS